MRRVLVPLDGSARSAAILPDARRLAGPNGVLILLHELGPAPYSDDALLHEELTDAQLSQEYLNGIAGGLRADNVAVETQTTLTDDLALGIDDAARTFHAEMVALATHAGALRERLPSGSIAQRAVIHSSVPVLIRHVADSPTISPTLQPTSRRVMVPLDGSEAAECVLPLACKLTDEWDASLWLVHVVSHYPVTDFARTETDPNAVTDEVAVRSAQLYLERVAEGLGRRVQTRVLVGSPVDELVRATASWGISDVVLSTRGSTHRAPAVLGSVADSLLHHLDLPMIMVPADQREPIGPRLPGRRKEDNHAGTREVPPDR